MKALAAILVLGLLQSCGGPNSEQVPATSTTQDDTATTSTGLPKPIDRVPTTVAPVTGEVPTELLQPVMEDAARLAGIAVSELEVMRSQAVEWLDGSLGCPRSGEVYIQVVIPGYWVEIVGPGSLYDYRLDDKGNFRLCEQKTPIGSMGTTITTTGGDSSD